VPEADCFSQLQPLNTFGQRGLGRCGPPMPGSTKFMQKPEKIKKFSLENAVSWNNSCIIYHIYCSQYNYGYHIDLLWHE